MAGAFGGTRHQPNGSVDDKEKATAGEAGSGLIEK